MLSAYSDQSILGVSPRGSNAGPSSYHGPRDKFRIRLTRLANGARSRTCHISSKNQHGRTDRASRSDPPWVQRRMLSERLRRVPYLSCHHAIHYRRIFRDTSEPTSHHTPISGNETGR